MPEPGKELFRFSPKIAGETVLSGDRIIEFRPANALKQDITYNVEFLLGEVARVEKGLEKMPFQFTTLAQSFSVTFDGLKNYAEGGYGQMQFSGTVLTADVMDPETAEKLLDATYEGSKIDISWQHDAGMKKHFFIIDSLARYDEEPTFLNIAWNGKALDIDNTGEKKITIPALNSFKVIEAKVVSNPAQHIQVRFSDPLLKNQDLEGLVQLGDKNNLRIEIDGNVINCWPEQFISGERNLSVFQGISNASYFKLKKTINFQLHFSSKNPEIRLVGNGVIVPQSNSLEMPFETIGLHAVEVRVIQVYKNNILRFFQENQFNGASNLKQVGRLVYEGEVDLKPNESGDFQSWNSYKVNLAALFKIEKGAIYRVEFRMKKEYSEYNCGNGKTQNSMKETGLPVAADTYQTQWDAPGWYSDYYYPPGFDWQERNNPCHISYYYSDRFVARNIFSSELGVIVKEGNDHELNFAVVNLLSTDPGNGVDIKLYNYQNRIIATALTDENGFARLKLKKKPFFMIAQKGDKFGYLRLDDGSSLSLSNFNVGGKEIREGMKGFLYGERGVWRPGDTLFINFIVDKEKAHLPDNYPIVFRLINPSGQIVEKQIAYESENNFYSFTPVTTADAPTGNWRVEAKAGNVTFSKRLKIEAVKPNRLKVELKFPSSTLTTKTKVIPMRASWLHGSPARSLKTKVDVLFVNDKTQFEEFGQFIFTDPASTFSPREQTIFEGHLNENGETKIPLDFQSLKNAPGMVNAWFTSRVFEEGGDFSINVTEVKYAPFNSFVGVRMPTSEDNWYKTDTNYSPEIVLVDAKGKPIEGSNIEAKLYKINWRWWWESGTENLAHYVSGRYYKPVQTWKIDNAKHKNKIKLNVKYHNWDDNGRYMLWVKDLGSGHAAGVTFYMSKWGGWRSGESADGATMLTLKTDKSKYSVGEKIEIKIPSSKIGKALVSIENGTEVTNIFWVKTEDKQTTFTIDATPEMAPNFYVHVSLIQPYGQTENDAPLRLYGVVPVLVEDAGTVLHPQISAPAEIEPEKNFEVKVSEANNQKMTYTLAIVDEGLLGLTGFKTPNPHQSFYAREALGVKTWDLYDFVAGAYGAKLERAFAVGGDAGLNNMGKRKTSRFKPVVQFAGPFTLEKGKSHTHYFRMPNYVGAVRMMVIAGNKGAYGKTEKTVPVRKGLMLLATLPRVLAPNEEVLLPVTIFAMKNGVKKVSLRIKTNNMLTVSGTPEQTVSFKQSGEKMAYFKLKAGGKTGMAKVEVAARSGNESATFNIELKVRNPNQPVVVEKSAIVKGGANWNTGLIPPGNPETTEAWIEVSSFPSLNLTKHLDYLIRYPHGCVEQITSSAFPQLYLASLTDLTPAQQLEIETNVRRTLEQLTAYQLPTGGFGYWPGNSTENEWGTSYAGHFILEAANRGYSIPAGMKKRWLNYQKTAARNWNPAGGYRNGIYYRNYDFTQAYRLYTLALAGSPDLGAMNRLREITHKPVEVIWRLAAAYFLAGQPEAATQLVNRLSVEINEYNEFGGTFGSALRDKAMILESLVLLNKPESAFEILKTISAELDSRSWISTQTAAWCLTSSARFAAKFFKEKSDTKFELITNGDRTEMQTKTPVVTIPVGLKSKSKISVKYNNKGKNATFVKVLARGIPSGTDSSLVSNNLAMRIKYLNTNSQEIDPRTIMQGEDFKLIVTVKHPGQRPDYKEMVLSTVFPSGWEIGNRRLNDIPENSKGSAGFEYQDIRDDRVYTYFNLKMNEQKTFTFNLNASYVGKYYQPPVSCEAMYDYSVRAQKPGRWVEVKK